MTPDIPRIFLEEPETKPVDDQPAKPWRKRKSTRAWIAGVSLIAFLILLQTFSDESSSVPYDPESTRPNGTKGFVELMQRANARVERDSYPDGDVAVIFYDTLDASETLQVERWVEAGGTLVISHPYSSFQLGNFADDIFSVPTKLQPRCDATYVQGVREISPSRKGTSQFFRHDLNSDNQCFQAGKKRAYFLEERAVGRGRIIALGGSEIFTNDRLDVADNAVLLTNIMRPSSAKPITILETRAETFSGSPTEDSPTIYSLMSSQFRDGLWMVLSAAVVFLLWNARRLGRPVDEDPLVRIPASQLVVATGDLLELADQPRAAAAMLRDDLRRTLAERFGLPADAEISVLVELVSQRSGIDPQRIRVALNDEAVTSPESLVVYAQQVERLQMEVRHVR
jgi:hypothetical protein